jgi:6-pyruvoyl-tetrahydropterin synthase
MVVDFGWLKERILHQIEKGFDHTLVLGQPDRDGINKIADLDPTSGCGKCVKVLGEALGLLTPLGSVMELGVVTLHNMSNPTAENLAKWCFDRADFEIQPLEVGEKRGLKVDYIRVYEQLHPTESYAEYFK